jgi:hypothetical protein
MEKIMKILKLTLLLSVLFLLSSCMGSIFEGTSTRNSSCDDGTTPSCRMDQPDCARGEILAYQNSCYECVNPVTCLAFGVAECTSDLQCEVDEVCNPCGTSSCYGCKDCVPACNENPCTTNEIAECATPRHDCGIGQTAIVVDGCWKCVYLSTCEATPSSADCKDDIDCSNDEYCNPCVPVCDICSACSPMCETNPCDTGEELLCFSSRPDCGDGNVSIIKEGCWECVDIQTCEPARNASCDDGTTPMCDMIEPVCDESEILAFQNECYKCVNPQTCIPWGIPTCSNDSQCPDQQRCDFCATSSCPECDNCVSGCVDNHCATAASNVTPSYDKPECGLENSPILKDGLWICVDNSYSCSEVRNPDCDDDSTPTCNLLVPLDCNDSEIEAVKNGCWECVNRVTCEPWGTAGCEDDLSCDINEYCDDCATSSGELLADCIAGCKDFSCETEFFATCNMMRPECGAGTAIIRNGCYACVDIQTCEDIDVTSNK